MEQPKFILTSSGHFRLGMVHLHKDLLQPGEACWGGGYYEFDYLTNRLLLSGRSYDFGRPQWERFATLKVPEVYRGLLLVYRASANGALLVVNHEMKIEWV